MNVDPNPYAPPEDATDSQVLATYHERIWLLVSRQIELYADRLHVTGNVRAIRIDANISVAGLVLPPDRVWLRSRHFIWATWLCWALIAILAVAYFALQTPLTTIAGLTALASIPLLPYILCSARQNEYYQYKNSSGVVVFDICRRGPSALEFDNFNAAIASAVDDAANHRMHDERRS